MRRCVDGTNFSSCSNNYFASGKNLHKKAATKKVKQYMQQEQPGLFLSKETFFAALCRIKNLKMRKKHTHFVLIMCSKFTAHCNV